MAPINVYWARGNTEPFGRPSMGTNVVALLDKKIFDVREVDYNAYVNGGYAVPQKSFRDWMNRNKDPNKAWMGFGYSLGAVLMGDFVGSLSLGTCKGIGLISDARRHRNQYYGSRRPAGWGIAGERLVSRPGGYPLWSMTEPGDPISEIPGDNGLRNLAPFVGFPKQQGPLPARSADMAYSWEWFSHYFPGNRHTNYAVEKVPGTTRTYTQALADEMNAEGRRLIAIGSV